MIIDWRSFNFSKKSVTEEVKFVGVYNLKIRKCPEKV